MTYEGGVLALNPLRYYQITDALGSSTVKDYGSNAQNGTVHPTVTFGQPSLIQGDPLTSALFDGSSGYISAATTGLITGSSPFTLLAWVMFANVPGAGNYPVFIELGTNSNGHDATFYFNGDQQKLSFGFKGLTDIFSSLAVTAHHVYFLAGTYDGTTGVFYCYDATAGLTDTNSHAEALNLIYGSFVIGTDATLAFWYGGTAGHITVIGSALSPDQITRLYNIGGKGLGGTSNTASIRRNSRVRGSDQPFYG